MFEYTKGYSEAPILRMTDYTMVKRKRPKGKTMIYKTLHRKFKIAQHESDWTTEG